MKKQGKDRLLEVMSRLDKTFKPKLNENFDGNSEEFVPHGSYTVSNSGGYEIMLNDAGDAAKVRDAYGSDNPQTSDWLEIEYVPDEDTGELEPVIDPNGYNIPLNQVMKINKQSGLGENTLNEDSSKSPINKFVYFGYNYPSTNFIDEVWSDNPNLAKHLKDKFMGYYERYGSDAVMNRFYVELSSENQRQLEDWIINNYRG